MERAMDTINLFQGQGNLLGIFRLTDGFDLWSRIDGEKYRNTPLAQFGNGMYAIDCCTIPVHQTRSGILT